MRKYLMIAATFLFIQPVLAQAEYEKVIIREIDSLKTILSGLKDNDRADCLNAISAKYSFTILPGKMDSMLIYAWAANKESNRISYKYGLANSLLNLASAKQFSKQDTARENYVRQALMIANEIKNDQLLGDAYHLLAGTTSDMNARKEIYKKAIYYFQKTGNIRKETEVTTWLSMMYLDQGEYEEAFSYCKNCIQLAQRNIKINKTEWDHELVQWSLFDMIELYKYAGDYETAMNYAKQFNTYAEKNNLIWKNYVDIELYCLLGKYDSALYYLQPKKESKENITKGKMATNNTLLGYVYLHTNQIDKAIPLFKESIEIFKNKSWGNTTIIKPLLYTGMAYAAKRNYPIALKYTSEALRLAKLNNARKYLVDSYELLSNIHHQLGKNDSAYFYLKQYTSLKDSILNRQFYFRLSNYKKETDGERRTGQINLLNKNNQLKEQKLKQQAIVKNSLIIGIALLLLLGIFIFRTLLLKRRNEKLRLMQLENDLKVQQLEHDKKHTDFQKKTADLEMQALRAQMNPHFIFNCLSSINRFILKNEPDTASDYLTRFSRLIRMVLLNSQKQLITLEDELEMLTIYLDMERLRFKNNFDYHIVFTNRVDAGAIFIPSLLLQPFCENAIWHGLKHLSDPQSGRQEQGQLDIELSMDDKILNCIITDNGIGREKASEIRSKSAEEKKSMGLKITTDRLALLNGEKGLATFYEIEDLKDEKGNATGTKVILKISYKESVEESV